MVCLLLLSNQHLLSSTQVLQAQHVEALQPNPVTLVSLLGDPRSAQQVDLRGSQSFALLIPFAGFAKGQVVAG